MAVALVHRKRHTVVPRPHDVARVVTVAQAECVTDLVEAHEVQHHVSHQRILTNPPPDAGPESFLVWPDENRRTRLTVRRRSFHPSHCAVLSERKPREAK